LDGRQVAFTAEDLLGRYYSFQDAVAWVSLKIKGVVILTPPPAPPSQAGERRYIEK